MAKRVAKSKNMLEVSRRTKVNLVIRHHRIDGSGSGAQAAASDRHFKIISSPKIGVWVLHDGGLSKCKYCV